MKRLILACCALLFTACGDDENGGTPDAAISADAATGGADAGGGGDAGGGEDAGGGDAGGADAG